jgi:UDP-N-acetylmuramyl pentapeptide phosphotransferase/UDP-N-acetylglucosamine-1-phosphate transferase
MRSNLPSAMEVLAVVVAFCVLAVVAVLLPAAWMRWPDQARRIRDVLVTSIAVIVLFVGIIAGLFLLETTTEINARLRAPAELWHVLLLGAFLAFGLYDMKQRLAAIAKGIAGLAIQRLHDR